MVLSDGGMGEVSIRFGNVRSRCMLKAVTLRGSLFLLCLLTLFAAPRGLGSGKACHESGSEHTHVHTHGGHTHSHSHTPTRHVRAASCNLADDAHEDEDHHHWCQQHHGHCHICSHCVVARMRTAVESSTASAPGTPAAASRSPRIAPPVLHLHTASRPPGHLKHVRSVVLRT